LVVGQILFNAVVAVNYYYEQQDVMGALHDCHSYIWVL